MVRRSDDMLLTCCWWNTWAPETMNIGADGDAYRDAEDGGWLSTKWVAHLPNEETAAAVGRCEIASLIVVVTQRKLAQFNNTRHLPEREREREREREKERESERESERERRGGRDGRREGGRARPEKWKSDWSSTVVFPIQLSLILQGWSIYVPSEIQRHAFVWCSQKNPFRDNYQWVTISWQPSVGHCVFLSRCNYDKLNMLRSMTLSRYNDMTPGTC